MKLKNPESSLKENQAIEKELSKEHKGLISQRDNLREDKKKLELKYEKEFNLFDKIKEQCSQIRYIISEFKTLSETLDEELETSYNEVKIELLSDNKTDTGKAQIRGIIKFC